MELNRNKSGKPNQESATNEKLGYTTIDKLETGRFYPVLYSCFKQRNGKRGTFMSASFIIQTGDGESDKVWISSPTEKSAYKAIGVMTAARSITDEKLIISGLEVVENKGYRDFSYFLEPYTKDETENHDA